jgi:hypothetical protein
MAHRRRDRLAFLTGVKGKGGDDPGGCNEWRGLAVQVNGKKIEELRSFLRIL